MDYVQENLGEPLSPMAQNFSSSMLRLYVVGVFEFDVAIDELQIVPVLADIFLHTNPRFSSIMVVRDKDGEKRWKKVDVKLEEHIIIPKFPEGLSIDSYDQCFGNYISTMAMEESPPNRPLWEVHIIKYPTRNAAGGSLVFRVHHAIGDGYSFMSLFLSTLRRADNPSLPPTFPSRMRSKPEFGNNRNFMRLPAGFFNSMSDFAWNLLHSGDVKDDNTPIKSGDEGVEFQPFVLSHITFSIDHLKEIKSKLGATINDVVTGVIFYGTRLYMQDVDYKSKRAYASARVVLNTRKVGYQSVEDMEKTDAEAGWGNKIVFMHIPMEKLEDGQDPLDFVWSAQKMINKRRHPFALFLTHQVSKTKGKLKGQEAVAGRLRDQLRNSSTMISNMIGPVEQVALANYPIKGLFFTVPGVPENLIFTIVSYMGSLRVTIKTEEGFLDEKKLMSCVEKAFESILKAASVIDCAKTNGEQIRLPTGLFLKSRQ